MIFSGKWLPVDQYFHLWPGNDFLPSFSLQSISGKRERERERERESARAREEKKPNSQSISRRRQSPVRASGGADLQSELQAARSRKDRREDRDLAIEGAISRRREIAISDRAIASSRLRSRSTARDRNLRSIARSRRRELAPLIARSRSLMIFFLGLCFPSSFPNTKKYFTGKFFEMQPNIEKYFPFPEISISEKYVFSGERFTATKHSLRAYITKPF